MDLAEHVGDEARRHVPLRLCDRYPRCLCESLPVRSLVCDRSHLYPRLHSPGVSTTPRNTLLTLDFDPLRYQRSLKRPLSFPQ